MIHGMQGDFDGLCGVYALINACSAAIPKLGYDKSKELFHVAINYLDSRRMLKNAILEGMSSKTLKSLISVIDEYCCENFGYKIKFESIAKSSGNIKGIIKSIDTWLEENDGCFVIIGLTGIYNHWTCVSKSCSKSFELMDSDGIKRLNFSRLTSGESRDEKDISIDKYEVFGISSEKI